MTLLQSRLPVTSRLFSLQYYILTINERTFQLKCVCVRNVFVLWGRGWDGMVGNYCQAFHHWLYTRFCCVLFKFVHF